MPTLRAAAECKNPAIIPAKTPNSPAIGARVVDNKSARRALGSVMLQFWIAPPSITPIMMGRMWMIPKEAKKPEDPRKAKKNI